MTDLLAASLSWQICPPAPLAWLQFREIILTWILNPALLLPTAAALAVAVAWSLHLPKRFWPFVALLMPLLISSIYSPAATDVLTDWLMAQLPGSPSGPVSHSVVSPGGDALVSVRPVAVLVGRGPAIAAATTDAAAFSLRHGQASAVYVSGDERATAERLLALGVAPSLVAGDSCARTTWENASLTAGWLRRHHPGAPVLLLTDPWQLPRATRAFQRQGLQVIPRVVDPPLPASLRNRLALRESAATLLYRLQGRI